MLTNWSDYLLMLALALQRYIADFNTLTVFEQKTPINDDFGNVSSVDYL